MFKLVFVGYYTAVFSELLMKSLFLVLCAFRDYESTFFKINFYLTCTTAGLTKLFAGEFNALKGTRLTFLPCRYSAAVQQGSIWFLWFFFFQIPRWARNWIKQWQLKSNAVHVCGFSRSFIECKGQGPGQQ